MTPQVEADIANVVLSMGGRCTHREASADLIPLHRREGPHDAHGRLMWKPRRGHGRGSPALPAPGAPCSIRARRHPARDALMALLHGGLCPGACHAVHAPPCASPFGMPPVRCRGGISARGARGGTQAARGNRAASVRVVRDASTRPAFSSAPAATSLLADEQGQRRSVRNRLPPTLAAVLTSARTATMAAAIATSVTYAIGAQLDRRLEQGWRRRQCLPVGAAVVTVVDRARCIGSASRLRSIGSPPSCARSHSQPCAAHVEHQNTGARQARGNVHRSIPHPQRARS